MQRASRTAKASSKKQVTQTTRWRVFGVAFAALLVPMILWSLASPLGSIPDEPSHFVRAAAVVRNEAVSPASPENPALAEAEVPRYVDRLHSWICYARNPTVTPACIVPDGLDSQQSVSSVTSAGTNSPVFYAVVGLPTLVLEGVPALYAMRIVDSLLCAAMLAFGIMQLRSLTRSRWAVAGAVIGVTPMVFYLAGSVNPNGVEAASAVALLSTLIALVRTPDASARMQWERAFGVIAVLTLLLGAKSLAFLWLLVIIVAVLAFVRRNDLARVVRQPPVIVLLAGSAIVSLVSLVWFTHPPHYEVGDIEPVSAASAFASMLGRNFEFVDGYVGVFGWLDTGSPQFTLMVWAAIIVAFAIAAFVWGAGRARTVAIGLAVVLIAAPPVIQAVLAPQVGYIWQGRYMLAIVLCFLVVSGMALDDAALPRALSVRWKQVAMIALGLMVAGQVFSFAWVLRRYVVGMDGSIASMVTSTEWQPPLGWIALTALLALWLIGSAVVIYRSILADKWEAEPAASITEAPAPKGDAAQYAS